MLVVVVVPAAIAVFVSVDLLATTFSEARRSSCCCGREGRLSRRMWLPLNDARWNGTNADANGNICTPPVEGDSAAIIMTSNRNGVVC